MSAGLPVRPRTDVNYSLPRVSETSLYLRSHTTACAPGLQYLRTRDEICCVFFASLQHLDPKLSGLVGND